MKMDDVEDIYELSPVQQGMLFHTLLAPGSGMYFEQVGFPLSGPLDVPSFERAWQTVLDRHTILRTSFHHDNLDKPLQVVRRGVKLSVDHLDWTNSSSDARQELLEEFLGEDRARGFDLTVAPLMRLTVIQFAPDNRYIVFSLHHLLLDGWSSDLVYKEAAAIYEAACRGEQLDLPPCRPFGDYIEWLQRQDLSEAETYWRQRLSGYKGAPPLGKTPRRGGEADENADIGELQARIGRDALDAMRQMARQNQLTLNTIVQGAWALLVARYMDEEDIVFGATISGRPAELEGVASMVGLFINTLPVRARVRPDAPLVAWLQELQRNEFEARRFEYAPLIQINAWRGSLSKGPLFETLLAFENFPTSIRAPQRDGAPEIRIFGKTNYPLAMAVVPANDLLMKLAYSRSRFDSDAMERLMNHFVQVLTNITNPRVRRLSEITLLTENDNVRLTEWNRTRTSYPGNRTIPQLFKEQVQRTPQAVAISSEGNELTYDELNRRSNRLGWHLQAAGVSRGSVVGICVDSPSDLITGMLGILKAGGAYVPLDPAYPEERLSFMLEDSGANALVITRSLSQPLKTSALAVIELDDFREWATAREDEPSNGTTSENLAYVMYTSGSTGLPKGTAVPHRAISRLVCNTNYISLGPPDRVAQASNASFDAATFEIWGALLHGARVVGVRKDVLLSPEALASLLAREQITTLFVTTDLFNQLASEDPGIFQTLRTLLFGGSSVNPRRVRQVLQGGRPGRLLHVYGPTESTTFASWHEIVDVAEDAVTIPIGLPIANTQLYVLDRFGQPAPIGVAGELHIGGEGVAQGYINRPELTAEMFVPDPFSGQHGAKLYRTGDRVLRRADGTIEFIGRFDTQVKIRGFRVELNEIEAVLQATPGVREAVAVVREDAPGTKRVVAYVSGSGNVSAPLLRRVLEKTLPDYMAPSAIVVREALPLTPNGKVDRNALLALEERLVPEKAYVEPGSHAEKLLAGIWSKVLGVTPVGIHDNFFELGGDSIISIQVIARAREAGLSLTLRQLFQNQTVAELAAVAGTEAVARPEKGTLVGEVPLLPIQRWFFDGQPLDAHHFNMATLMEAPPGLDMSLLARSTEQLLVHHDALRLRFRHDGAQWRQFYEAFIGPAPLRVVDLRTAAGEDLRARIEQEVDETQKSLDLESGPVLRVVWFDLGERPGRLLFVIHHLVVDNVSWQVLLEDFWRIYKGLGLEGRILLPAKTSSLRQWATRLNEYAQSAAVRDELTYWIAEVGEQKGRAPLDFAGGSNIAAAAKSVTVELDEENTQALLRETPKAYQTQINDVLLTALAQTLAAWTGERKVRFDLEGHGREPLFEDIDLTRTVGWFTTMFPVRLQIAGEHPGETLKAVKEQLRQIPNRGITYGLLRYLNADAEVRRTLAAIPAPDIAFNYQGQFEALPEVESSGDPRSARAQRAHLIEINGVISGGRLRAHWEFSERHHSRATIERVAADFMDRLVALITHCRSSKETVFTPSDFAQAGISQKDLDKLVGAIGRTEGPAS